MLAMPALLMSTSRPPNRRSDVGKQCAHRRLVGDVGCDVHVTVVGERRDAAGAADHDVAAFEEMANQIGADAAAGAGDEDPSPIAHDAGRTLSCMKATSAGTLRNGLRDCDIARASLSVTACPRSCNAFFDVDQQRDEAERIERAAVTEDDGIFANGESRFGPSRQVDLLDRSLHEAADFGGRHNGGSMR